MGWKYSVGSFKFKFIYQFKEISVIFHMIFCSHTIGWLMPIRCICHYPQDMLERIMNNHFKTSSIVTTFATQWCLSVVWIPNIQHYWKIFKKCLTTLFGDFCYNMGLFVSGEKCKKFNIAITTSWNGPEIEFSTNLLV